MIIHRISERRKKSRRSKRKFYKWILILSRLFLVFLVIISLVFLTKFLIHKFSSIKLAEVIEAHVTEVPFTVSSKGLVTKKEKIYTSQMEGTLHQLLTEGQKAAKGDVVAKVYNYQLEMTLKQRKLEMKKQAVFLRLSLNRCITKWKLQDSLLMSQVNQKVDALKNLLLESKLDEGEKIQQEIKEIVVKRQDLEKEKRKYQAEVTAKLQMLQKENAHINLSMGKDVSFLIKAEQDGIVSYYIDGYEEKLCSDIFFQNPIWDFPKIETSPVRVRDGQKISQGGPVFKLIQLPYYIVTKVPSDKKDYFETKEQRVVLIPNLNIQVASLIEKIYDRGYQSPELLVIFSTNQVESSLLAQREISLDILLSRVNGVALPLTAKVEKYGEVGVYIVENNRAKFYPIRVKAEDKKQFAVEGLKDGALVIPDAKNITENTKVVINRDGEN